MMVVVVVSVVIETEALQQRIAGEKYTLPDHSEHQRNKDAREATTSQQRIIVRSAAMVVVVVVMSHFFFKVQNSNKPNRSSQRVAISPIPYH